jgi:hypothetical protein
MRQVYFDLKNKETSNLYKCVWIVYNKILNAELKETNILLTK